MNDAQRIANGDPDAAHSLGRESIAALDRSVEGARRQLAQENLRPESRSHWSLEIRARENELASRRAALITVDAPPTSRPAVPHRSIYVLKDHEVNNRWYILPPNAETAFVFVHGILSNSKSCWLNDADPLKHVYWPDLVAEDGRLDHPAIFLGGFHTAIDSGLYDIRDAARELMDALLLTDKESRPPVMDFRNIVFICHSTGGIVVRYLLERGKERFTDKNVGLVLIASPSFGSYLADKLSFLTRLFNQKMGRQLEWGNESLEELDDRFNSLVGNRDIPHLAGVEACEHHFIKHYKLWPSRTVVVEKESAARYFPEPRRLAGTDHFSSVKPSTFEHPAHKLLVGFYSQKFKPMVKEAKEDQR